MTFLGCSFNSWSDLWNHCRCQKQEYRNRIPLRFSVQYLCLGLLLFL